MLWLAWMVSSGQQWGQSAAGTPICACIVRINKSLLVCRAKLMYVCVHACVRAFVHACQRAYVRVCVMGSHASPKEKALSFGCTHASPHKALSNLEAIREWHGGWVASEKSAWRLWHTLWVFSRISREGNRDALPYPALKDTLSSASCSHKASPAAPAAALN
eukprot:1144657-Pelagomonas_calceolata.AAC.11